MAAKKIVLNKEQIQAALNEAQAQLEYDANVEILKKDILKLENKAKKMGIRISTSFRGLSGTYFYRG